MNKRQRMMAGVLAIVAGVGIIVAAAVVGNNQKTSELVTEDSNTPVKVCPIAETAGVTAVNYDGVVDETALVTLQGLCDVATQSSDFGDFVTGIDGRDGGDTHYWAFYVNDEYASEGAGTYKVKDGDRIKWVLTATDADY